MDPIFRMCSVPNGTWTSVLWQPDDDCFNYCFVLLVAVVCNVGVFATALSSLTFSVRAERSSSRPAGLVVVCSACASLCSTVAFAGLCLSQLQRTRLQSDLFIQVQFTFGLACLAHLPLAVLHGLAKTPATAYSRTCLSVLTTGATANYCMLVVQTRTMPQRAVFGLCCTLLAAHALYMAAVICTRLHARRSAQLLQHTRQSDEQALLTQSPGAGGALSHGDDSASLLSRLLFLWINPLLRRGRAGALRSTDDVFQLPQRLNVRHTYNLFATQHTVQDEPVRVIRQALRAFGAHYFSLGVFRFSSDMLNFVGPVLLHELVRFIGDRDERLWKGYALAAGMAAAAGLSALCNWHFNYGVNVVALQLKAALQMATYRKLLATRLCSMADVSTGQLLNFVSTDVDRVIGFCNSFHSIWSLPVQLVVGMYLIYREVGIAFVTVIVICVFLLPLNKYLAMKLGALSAAMMQAKDARARVGLSGLAVSVSAAAAAVKLQLVTEVLFGIRPVKLSNWAGSLRRRIERLRAVELRVLASRKYLDALCVYLWASVPLLISLGVFLTYVLGGHVLTAAKVFTCLALVNILIVPINAFPWALTGLIESYVSVRRLQSFFDRPEAATFVAQLGDEDELCAAAVDCSIGWTAQTPVVQQLNMQIEQGQLVLVRGAVGSGKTSLLLALCHELPVLHGHLLFSASGGVGYCTQEPWLQHGSVRDNIVFGSEYRHDWYNQVVDACALTTDIQAMPNGDACELGEQGVTVSGGQRARLALARALYQDYDIYLLDEPFSAVDAAVAQHIWRQAVVKLMKLRGKTVIVSTHLTGLQLQADYVLTLRTDAEPTFTADSVSECSPDTFQSPAAVEPSAVYNDENVEAVLVTEEEKETGSVELKVYKAYAAAVGYWLSAFVLLCLTLMQVSQNATDMWLAHWVSHNADGNDSSSSWSRQPDSEQYNVTVYALLAGVNSACTLLRSFAFAYAGLLAARTLHSRLLSTILNATVGFFDAMPVGRIVNRLSSDVYMVDEWLPFQANICLMFVFKLFGSAVVMCAALPAFAAVMLAICLLYFYIQRYYRYSNSELKRLCSMSVSPVNAHLTDTIQGLASIRAFAHVQRFVGGMERVLSDCVRAQYSSVALGVWLSVRLQLLAVLAVSAVALIAVLQHQWHLAHPGLVGLALTYGLSFTSLLNGLLTSFADTEKELVSVERITDYINNVAAEKDCVTAFVAQVPDDWPSEGKVEFIDVRLSYDEHLPDALKNVSFSASPGEKLAVVGRTGCGKSSLFQALFRATPIRSGAIYIDNVNIHNVPLHKLRSSLSIIPQSPVLFSGTLRDNMDIDGEHSDAAVMAALVRVGLAELCARLGGLDGQLGERGAGLSVGQRQMVCLARALLHRAKIVCVDEATAHVDHKTDALMQRVMRECFADSTVLSIAHRTASISHCHRVLVMNAGTVQRICTPDQL